MRATRSLLVTMAVASLLLLPTHAAADLQSLKTSGEALVGFTGPIDLLLLSGPDVTVVRVLERVGVVHVASSDLEGLSQRLAGVSGVSFVERNDPVRLIETTSVLSVSTETASLDASGSKGTSWDGTSWDATSWDATSWDGTSWDSTSWDSTGWDGTSWDGTSWDGTSWDGTSWDSTGWDSTGWDATSWDSTSWDATSWDLGSWSGGMDPGWPDQWGLGAANFLDAWRIEEGRGHVGICMLDTGVDASHPDLRPQLLQKDGAYGVSAMGPGTSPADDVGHGTHVAGIMAAVTGNASGVAGAAREPVLSVKVMDASGGKEADLANGLAICARSGARVATMSLHLDKASPTVERAVREAQAAGLLLVAAVGNDAGPSVRYPAAYPGVLAVGAVTPAAQKANFSNYGPRLDLLAPGDHIASTFLGGSYRIGSGTSQAAPFAAAAAALVWERNPSLGATRVREILLTTARDLGPAGRDDLTGWGALNAGAAVQVAV